MKSLFLALAIFCSQTSLAWISEEIDDHASTACSASNFELSTKENRVSATAYSLQGQVVGLDGELVSLTIDTDDGSLYYKVTLDQPNAYGFRYLTIDTVNGKSTVAVHYSLSQVAGLVGNDIRCATRWKSQQ
ncbi:MAG: hypothetical protein AAF202_12005, partial [Pseudomonadota bacterium]